MVSVDWSTVLSTDLRYGVWGGAATARSCVCAKMVEEESLRVVRCGGSQLNFRRAVFSADSKYGATALRRLG